MNNKKLLIIFLFVAFIIIAILIVTTQTEVPKEDKVIKVGAILPLTGNNAVTGKEEMDGMKLALGMKNQTSREIQLIFEDFAGDPKQAVSIFQKMIIKDKPHAIFVSTSPGVNAIFPLANKYPEVLFFAITTQKKVVTSNNVFRIWPSVKVETELLNQYLKRHPDRKIIIMYPTNELGKDAYNEIKKENGDRFLLEMPHDLATTDFRGEMTKIASIKNYHECILVAWTYPTQTLSILKKIDELKMKFFSVVTSIGTDYPFVLEYLKSSSTSPIFAVTEYDVSEKRGEFEIAFKEKYGYLPNWNVAAAFDNMRFLLKLIESCQDIEGDKFRDCLFQQLLLIELTGVSGNIKISENNEAHFPMVLVTYDKNKGIVPFSEGDF